MEHIDRFLEKFTLWGEQEEGLSAAVVIGSQARSDHPADEFSDLDFILFADRPEDFLRSDRWAAQLGDVRISFLEETLNGLTERRFLFDDALDTDFLFLPTAQFAEAAANAAFTGILSRGYRVLVDKIGLAPLLPQLSLARPRLTPPTEEEYANLVGNFWYHTVWTAKKLIRGELWTAKSCLDGYMKQQLLTLLEWHTRARKGWDFDTWHSGRFLEEWADARFVQKLSRCFAHYEGKDMREALVATMDLFRLVAKETAQALAYPYPANADAFAAGWVASALR